MGETAGETAGARPGVIAASALIVISVALIAALIAWQTGVLSGPGLHAVYVVNGTPAAYEAAFGGRSIRVEGMSHSVAELREGEYDVTVTPESLGIPPGRIAVRPPGEDRQRIIVVNPDRAALIIWESTVYSQGPPARAGDFRLHVGEPLYVFPGVDFPFAEFPEKIPMPSGGGRYRKERVFQADDLDAAAMTALVHGKAGADASKDFVRRMARYDPADEAYVRALSEMLTPAESIAFLRPGLSARPVRVDWHRMYQTAVEAAVPGHDLEGEYRKMLETEGETPAALYLLGRAASDPVRGEEFIRKAALMEGACPQAVYSLAYLELSLGRFEEALSQSRKALAASPGRDDFRSVETSALAALGRWEELLRRHRSAGEPDPADGWAADTEVSFLLAMGRTDEARRRIDEFLDRNRADAPPAFLAMWTNWLNARYHHMTGDSVAAGELLAKSPGEHNRFMGLFMQGRLDEAATARAEIRGTAGKAPVLFHLLTYLAAASEGKGELADAALADAVAGMRGTGRQEREIAECLAGERKPDPERILKLVIEPARKRLLLAAMGTKFPADRRSYFGLARRLNYDVFFPHLFLKKLLG